MESSAIFSNTYPVLLTPPYPPLESSQTDSSPFVEANLAVNELIRAMKNKTNELQTSAPAEHLTIATKSPKIAFPTFPGKPLAMALYKPRRKRVARLPRMPRHVGERKQKCRKPRSVPPLRDSKEKFSLSSLISPTQATEVSSMTDTTPTQGSSERHPPILTEPVFIVSPPDMEPQLQLIASQIVQPDAQAANQAVLLDVGSSLISELTFLCLHQIHSLHFFILILSYQNSLKINHFFFVESNSFTNTIIHILSHSFN